MTTTYRRREGSNYRPFQRKLTHLQAARLVEDIRVRGMSIRAAAKKYGVNPSTASRYLNPEKRREPKGVAPCGTSAAYRRHLYHHEPPCVACQDANRAQYTPKTEEEREARREYSREYRRRKKAEGSPADPWRARGPRYRTQQKIRARERRAEWAAKIASGNLTSEEQAQVDARRAHRAAYMRRKRAEAKAAQEKLAA